MCPDCGRRIRAKGEEKLKGDNSVAAASTGPRCSVCYRRYLKSSEYIPLKGSVRYNWAATEYYCAHCKVRMVPNRMKRKGDGFVRHGVGDSCSLCLSRVRLGLEIFQYDPESKICRDCLRVLPHKSFTNAGSTSNSRALAQCNFGRDLKRKYKIGCGDYFHLLSLQNSCCKICNVSEDNFTRRLHVDHDHDCCPGSTSCGQCIRGLLCANCNIGLGKIKDDLTIVQSMIEYLEVDSGLETMI